MPVNAPLTVGVRPTPGTAGPVIARRATTSSHSDKGQLCLLGRVDKVLDRLLWGPLEHAVPQVEQVAAPAALADALLHGGVDLLLATHEDGGVDIALHQPLRPQHFPRLPGPAGKR